MITRLIDYARTALASRHFPPVERGWFASDLHRDVLATLALQHAISEIGNGESGGNNLGPDVARYVAPAVPPQNWCAGFVGWCYEQAAQELGGGLPFRRSLGARKLAANIATVGGRFFDPRLAKPGDVMLFARGARGSWSGHVAIIDKCEPDIADVILTVEGNSGPLVRRVARTIDSRFLGFYSIRR